MNKLKGLQLIIIEVYLKLRLYIRVTSEPAAEIDSINANIQDL
jgi:hypothetical protein